MSKINYIIYRPDTCNLQTKIVLKWDQEKLLKHIDLHFFINSNSKIPQMEHCLCFKMFWYTDLACEIYSFK